MTYLSRILCAAFVAILLASAVSAQSMDRIARDQMKEMLANIKNTIKKNYYDPNFHGIDIDARFEKANKRMDEISTTGQAFGVIAQVLIEFEDSHLYFRPPGTTVSVQYGFAVQMVGDKAFVSAVKPKSDAAAKGLKPGDEVLLFEGFKPTRKDLWKMIYYYYGLSPRNKLRLKILHPGAAEPVDMEVIAKLKQRPQTVDLTSHFDVNELIRELDDDAAQEAHYLLTLGNTSVWKMLTFSVDPLQINEIMASKVTGRQNLILDLRGNGGGLIKTLEQLAGHFVPKDAKIADRKGRPEKKKENEPIVAKARNDHFTGKLIVLIDSQSGSASELFARFVQLEKRGIVLGDVSAGAVMQSISYPLKMMSGMDKEIYYGASITNADLIMTDGKSLEHVGVVPDELIVPTAEDMAKKRDPVLARALELVGAKVSPEDAWKMFEKANSWDDN